MKKFFITIGVLVLALSIFGIYDNAQKKKEEEALAAKTSQFYATVDSIEGDDGEKKIVLTANDDDTNDKKYKGKKYSIAEGAVEKLELLNQANEKIKLTDLAVGKSIYVQNVGDVKDGDVTELLGKVTLYLIEDTAETTATDAVDTTEETQATETTQETVAE